VSLLFESLEWGGELEWPEEVVGLLEVWADGPDLVDQVLDAGDTLLAERLVDDAVVGKGDSRSVDLAVSTLVDESLDGVTGWVSVGHVWLDVADHVDGSSVQTDEHTVVELTESQQLHDLLLLGWELVDTKKQNANGLALVNMKTNGAANQRVGLLTHEF